jgi:hypothetical protein
VRELESVLMLLLAGLAQLIGEIAVGALNTQKSEE